MDGQVYLRKRSLLLSDGGKGKEKKRKSTADTWWSSTDLAFWRLFASTTHGFCFLHILKSLITPKIIVAPAKLGKNILLIL